MVNMKKMDSCISNLGNKSYHDGACLVYGWVKQGLISDAFEFLVLMEKVKLVDAGEPSKSCGSEYPGLAGFVCRASKKNESATPPPMPKEPESRRLYASIEG